MLVMNCILCLCRLNACSGLIRLPEDDYGKSKQAKVPDTPAIVVF
jgi:hypothetical protein